MTGSNNPNQGERAAPPNVARADLSSNDPYAILGVERDATLRQIKKGYFALVREFPPETEPEAFKIVRAAYEKLRTAESKAQTDLFLLRPPTPLTPRKRRKKLNLTVSPLDMICYLEGLSELAEHEFSGDYRPIKL